MPHPIIILCSKCHAMCGNAIIQALARLDILKKKKNGWEGVGDICKCNIKGDVDILNKL